MLASAPVRPIESGTGEEPSTERERWSEEGTAAARIQEEEGQIQAAAEACLWEGTARVRLSRTPERQGEDEAAASRHEEAAHDRLS